MRVTRSFKILFLTNAAFFLFGFVFWVGDSLAKTPPAPVADYPIDCGETFSCPDSLMPRVNFWIEVFSRWNTDTAVFHDKENPQRVYSVLNRRNGCRGSGKGGVIERERKRIKRNLRGLSQRLKSGKSDALSATQTHLNRLFVGETPKEIAAAANRVRCQSGNRDRMAHALTQFHLYRPMILDALEKQSLTPELQYLPFVESAFNPKALSHVGAAGMWQIMPATGRRLGLVVNDRIDQRYDPRDATVAAALYFRNSVNDLTETAFENGHTVTAKELNPFVITSYNYGVRGMQRAIKQVGLDYERLLVEYKSPSFQTAVKNFYASFLAARHVAKHSEQFFGTIKPDQSDFPASFNTVKLWRATSAKRLIKQLKLNEVEFKRLNPAINQVVWRHKALIPKGYQIRLPFRDQGWKQAIARVDQLPKEIERAGHTWHKVRRGQTACGIAERYGASCRALRRINKLDSRATIYVGQRIKVPSKMGGIQVARNSAKAAAGVTPAVRAPSTTPPAESNKTLTTYRIQKGDTPCGVAHRFGMLCSEFLAVNGLQFSSLIRVGQRVTVSDAGSWHVVTRGQTPCGIAKKYRVRCSSLLDANQLTSRSVIQVGQRLRVPHIGY